mgnify:FL=1
MTFLKKESANKKWAVIGNLGQKPSQFKAVSYANGAALNLPKYQRKAPKSKELLGVDLFVHWNGSSADELAEKVQQINTSEVQISMITNRGIKVWPDGFSETFCTDHWRCRFKPLEGKNLDKQQIIQLLGAAHDKGIDVVKTENLYAFDGKPAFSLGQGQ